MRRLLLILGLVLGTSLALAQTTPLYRWTGSELIGVTLGSGSRVSTIMDVIRNTRGISTIGLGQTVNVSPTGAIPNMGNLLLTAAVSTLGVTLPNPANQGQSFCISNGTGSNQASITVAASPVTSVQTHTLNTTFSNQTINAAGSACWLFNMTSDTAGTWFRVQ